MKIEASETEVRLLPETDWERLQLDRLRNNGVESVQWSDSWEQTGDLVLTLQQHPWDKEQR